MQHVTLATAIALLPALAMAAPPDVPAVAPAPPAIVAIATPPNGGMTTVVPNDKDVVAPPGSKVVVPPGLPPPLHKMSPSAPLNPKEKVSATLAERWRNHPDRPAPGPDGTVRWPFGQSQPSVVCAPLQICDVALEPGETVTSIHVGDGVMWLISPTVTMAGEQPTTHLVIKVLDAGQSSSVAIFTDKRMYDIKLISTQKNYTPMTSFSYGSDTEKQWAEYNANYGANAQRVSTIGGAGGPINFHYKISGDHPEWRPIRVYAMSGKTYIEFPQAISYGTAPSIMGLANDAGWFSFIGIGGPTEQMLRYRFNGTETIIIDGLPEHFILTEGVGHSQTKVDVRKEG